MREKIFTMAVLAAMVALTSCNKENSEIKDPSKYITIDAGVGSLTRATSTAFEKDDEISVYAWTDSNSAVSSDLVVNNSINKYDGTNWIATPMMLWKDMLTKHYFIGVYPKKTITDFTADSYSTVSDVLVATVLGDGREAKDGIVPMVFDHVMAKLVVNLTLRSQFTNLTVTSVTAEAKEESTVNYLTKSVTAVGALTDIPLVATIANKNYAGIMVPQTINNIDITIDGKVYTYNNVTGFELAGGKIQTVNLIVGRDEITLGSIIINDWETGTTIEGGEAQEK